MIADINYDIIQATSGRKVMLFQNYTFSNSWKSRCWYCSRRRATKCPASVIIDKFGNVMKYNTNHNH